LYVKRALMYVYLLESLTSHSAGLSTGATLSALAPFWCGTHSDALRDEEDHLRNKELEAAQVVAAGGWHRRASKSFKV